MKKILFNKKALSLIVGATISLISFTGCSSEKITMPEEYPIVLEDMSGAEDKEVQELVNSIPFYNDDFRESFYNFVSNDRFRQDYFVYDYWEVTSLSLDSVNDLTDLRLFPNLKSLTITNSTIMDLSPISELELNSLEIDNSQVCFDNIYNNSLVNLTLYNCSVTNVEKISDLKKIKYLNFQFTDADNLEFITELGDLETLVLVNSNIEDYSCLVNSNVTELIISCSHLNDWDFLYNMKQLKSLNLSFTNFSDLEYLKNLYKLEHLDISYTYVDDLSAIEHLDELENINITSCQELDDYDEINSIKNIEFISATNLEMKYNRNCAYLIQKDSEIADDAKVKENIVDLYNSLKIENSMTDKEKVKLITIAILNQITYTEDSSGEFLEYCNSNELETAWDGEGICSSYAGLAKAMLDLAGIDSYVIAGENINGNPDYLHRWNIVNIDGKWYGLDLTFLDDLNAVEALSEDENALYYLSDLSSKEWQEYHYAFSMPEIGEGYSLNLAK